MIGFHVSRGFLGAESLVGALDNAAELSRRHNLPPCAQIFVTGPQNYRRLLSAADVAALRDNDTVIVIHGAYVDTPWRVDNTKSIENIKYEAKMAAKTAAAGVVVHLSAGACDDSILENTMLALAGVTTTIWLEIGTAKPSASTFETPAKLLRLFERIRACDKHPRVGLCIDTAHLWSCGVDIGDTAISAEWFAAIAAIGCKIMMHLNDSAAALGSGVDRHAALGAGGVFAGGRGLAEVAAWARDHCEYIILEREEGSIESDLVLLKKLNESTNITNGTRKD